jgi:hypothetical protein
MSKFALDAKLKASVEDILNGSKQEARRLAKAGRPNLTPPAKTFPYSMGRYPKLSTNWLHKYSMEKHISTDV